MGWGRGERQIGKGGTNIEKKKDKKKSWLLINKIINIKSNYLNLFLTVGDLGGSLALKVSVK